MGILAAVLEVASMGGLAAALGMAAATDLARRVIPNGCAAAVAALGALRAAARGELACAALGAGVVLAVLLAAAGASRRLSGSVGVGGGDVKLLSAVGSWTGPVLGLAVVGVACLLAVAGWGARALCSRLLGTPRAPDSVPLAPSIALATLAAVLLRAPPVAFA